MVDEEATDERPQKTPPHDSENQRGNPPAEPPSPHTDWKGWLGALRKRLQEQVAVWPEQIDQRLDLVTLERSRHLPDDGDILIYVHGYLGEGRLEGINASGANQAAALQQALADEFEETRGSPPTVVAGMWDSSALWPTATKRAVMAGRTLADWIDANADRYDRLTLVGHSLGGRVAFITLGYLEQAAVDSVGLLGAAVNSAAVRTDYRWGIESRVTDGVYNYHSVNDRVVCNLYSFRERHDAIGCTGTVLPDESESVEGTLPQNYLDIDVSKTVHRHMDYFKPVSNTAVGNCLSQLVSNQL